MDINLVGSHKGTHIHPRAMRNSLDVSSVLSSDDLADYDVISEGHRSLESSIADLGLVDKPAEDIYEPPASQAARERLFTPSLSADDIQAHVQRAVANGNGLMLRDNGQRIVKVYVDGTFDRFNAG